MNWRMIRIMCSILLILFGNACSGARRSATRGSVLLPSGYPEIEQRIFQAVNEYRRGKGLAELRWDETVSSQCRQHCLDMASSDTWLEHQGVERRAENISRHIRFREIGENVAKNSGHADPALAAFEQWRLSAHHRETMEGDFDITGIGVDRSRSGTYYFVQIFVAVR